MNPSLACVIALVTAIPLDAAFALERADLQAVAIPAMELKAVEARTILERAKRIAAERGISLRVEEGEKAEAFSAPVSLSVEGLTLDSLLEIIVSQTGLEWTIRDGAAVVFHDAEIAARRERQREHPVRVQLRKLEIGAISFADMPAAAAFEKAREVAADRYGTSAVPAIDVNGTEAISARITATIRYTNLDALFEILAALSKGQIDWGFRGSRIALIDEVKKRAAIAAAHRERESVDAFAGDPFSSSGAPVTGSSAISRDPDLVPPGGFNTESYERFGDNPFQSPKLEPLSTFSIDVDTASYANVRRLIQSGESVPPDAARIEELINYFRYDYKPPAVGDPGEPPPGPPFAVHLDAGSAPWQPAHRLVRVALKGYEIDWEKRPPSNLVFLLDVSGSMSSPNKLDLVKRALPLLTRQLSERDRVAIAVYAGASGLVLPSTPGNDREAIEGAIARLESGGSTNGGEGIHLAYKTARENRIPDGNNRVILCTDGDFNVGVTDTGSLTSIVAEEAKAGIALTILGFGMGNLKDDLLESLSNDGDGNYGYIDSFAEARKVFVNDLTGTLITIARDVKVQVEFNPAKVGAYRLIGYENRILDAQDFNDDTVDAGDIGSGHTVTAFYEIAPPETADAVLRKVDPLKYRKIEEAPESDAAASDELLTVKLRYKPPGSDQSELLEFPFTDHGRPFADADDDFRFASAVAAFGMILRESGYRGSASRAMVLETARGSLGDDSEGYRAEFVRLAEKLPAL